MKLYEVYAHEGSGFIQWPITVAYFESPDLAERWCDMQRDITGSVYVVREIERIDRGARRDLLAWEKRKAREADAST